MYTDSHNHTSQFSADAAMTAPELLAAAKRRGLDAVVITEHYEMDYPHEIDKELMFNIDEYFTSFSAWKKILPAGLRLFSGIELGYQPHLSATFDRLAASYPFDSIIMSDHLFNRKDPYYFRDCYSKPKSEVYAGYISELTDMVLSCSNFDIVGHYDYIARYAPYENPTVKYRDLPESFDRFLSAVVQKGKSLEINTRSISKFLANGIMDAWPDKEIIRRYLALGGSRGTLGSDSHDTSTLGCYFEETAAYLKECGITDLTTYAARKEIRTPII